MPVLRKAPGRPVTLTALARNLGLSASTVSFVLNGNAKRHRIHHKTVQRVLKAAQKHGYVANEAARYLKTQRTGMIGVILGDISHDRAYFATKGMLPVLEREGFTPFISTSFWDVERHTRQLLSYAQRRSEGILCEPFPDAIDAYRQITRQGTPLVFFGDALEEMPEVSSVAWDTAAVSLAVRHLIDIGRKRIGFVGHRWPTQYVRGVFRTYQTTLRDAGLSYDPSWIGEVTYPKTIESWVDALLLQAGERPDAFFVGDDAIALHLLTCLEERGVRVPEDIAIMGMGDFPLSSVYGGRYGAGLSTVRQPMEQIGRQAAEMVIELIRHPRRQPLHVTMPLHSTELIVRRTTSGVPFKTESSATRKQGRDGSRGPPRRSDY